MGAADKYPQKQESRIMWIRVQQVSIRKTRNQEFCGDKFSRKVSTKTGIRDYVGKRSTEKSPQDQNTKRLWKE